MDYLRLFVLTSIIVFTAWAVLFVVAQTYVNRCADRGMKYADMPRWGGNTLIGWMNILWFQWTFCRVTYEIRDDTMVVVGGNVIGLIVPMTGWWNGYWYIWRLGG